MTAKTPSRFQRSMPVIEVSDVVKSAGWYGRVLGLAPGPFWGDPPAFCIVGRDTITLALDQSRSQSDGVARAIPVNQYWAAYFYIEDIGSYREELLARGAEIFRGPEDAIYGCREIDIKDPDGHILCFAQDLTPSADGPGLG